MNNKALINSFVWPGLPFCARLTLTVVVRFFLRLIFLIFLRLTAKILSFLRLTAKFLAVLRLTVNPIETLLSDPGVCSPESFEIVRCDAMHFGEQTCGK